MFFAFGIQILVACFQYDYSDELSAKLVGWIAVCFGCDMITITINNFTKYSRSKCTYLIVTTDLINGKINGKDFFIRAQDIASTSIQICSLACETDGTPKNMKPGVYSKLLASSNKYLCIYTNVGKTIFIDCLTSPEAAKNTIDVMIAKNRAISKETV